LTSGEEDDEDFSPNTKSTDKKGTKKKKPASNKRKRDVEDE